MKAEIGEYANNPEALLLEAVHSAGYSGPLANPLVASEGLLSRINSTVLEDFVAVSLADSHYSFFFLVFRRYLGLLIYIAYLLTLCVSKANKRS